MIKIKVRKEAQYLVFELDNNKTVKYDFQKKQTIGLSGKPVKDLKSQLRGITIEEIIESCEDKNYAEFLSFLKRKYEFYYSNVGSFLSMIRENANLEQLFSSGLKAEQLPNNFFYSIKDLPKSLVKIAKEKNIYISNCFVKFWKENTDAHFIAYEIEYLTLNYRDLYILFDYSVYNFEEDCHKSLFNLLLEKYNYNAKSLLTFFDYLKTYEAIENMEYMIKELYDYAKMMDEISDKFDKYPKNFLTTHKIACRNYNRLKKEFEEEKFRSRINKNYECCFGEYIFVYPNSTQDIKDEAVQQNNCVASYIENVINGTCHILFLRKRNQKDKSLVTIEVDPVRNIIVQAKGKFNRDVTEEENKAIETWNKKFSINKDMEVAA